MLSQNILNYVIFLFIISYSLSARFSVASRSKKKPSKNLANVCRLKCYNLKEMKVKCKRHGMEVKEKQVNLNGLTAAKEIEFNDFMIFHQSSHKKVTNRQLIYGRIR